MLTMREYETAELGDDIYLPDMLSDILRDAVEVALDVDRDIFIPDHEATFDPTEAGTPMQVRANLAGLVMAGRFRASPYGARIADDFARNAGRLLAIMEASEGNLDKAVALCDFDFAPSDDEVAERVAELSAGWSDAQNALIAKYGSNPPGYGKYADWVEFERFCGNIRKLADEAASVGW